MSVVIQSSFSDLISCFPSLLHVLPRLSPGRSSSDLHSAGSRGHSRGGKKPTGGDTVTGETERETEREIERKQ